MNIVIPLAGMSIFDTKNFFYPAPLIDVDGLPLIQYVTENLETIEGDKKYVYIIKEEDSIKYHLDNTLKLLTPNCEIIKLKAKTKGAVCSILLAIDSIDKEEETIIVNADQVFDCNLNLILKNFRQRKADGAVITFNSVHPRWSYILSDDDLNVLQAVEKNPISKNAIAGFYYFKSFNLFVDSAFRAIEIEDFYNENLYTSALLNQLILMNKNVVNYQIEAKKYKSFYSPQTIKEFENYILKKN